MPKWVLMHIYMAQLTSSRNQLSTAAHRSSVCVWFPRRAPHRQSASTAHEAFNIPTATTRLVPAQKIEQSPPALKYRWRWAR